MKNTFLCFATLLFVCNALAQDQKLSVTLSYPLPIDKNFVGENYTGVIDLGLQYRFVDVEIVKIGASVNGSYLVFQDNPAPQTDKVNAYFVQPRIFGELLLPALKKFRPSLGLGYTFTSFKAKISGSGVSDFSESYGGINVNLGFYFDITNRIFTHLHYDFVKVSREDGVPDVKENTNISQIKVGVGLRI